MAVSNRVLRLLGRLFAPLFIAQDFNQALGMILPQLLVIAALIGTAYGFLWSFVPPAIIILSALALLALLAGYNLLTENDDLNEKRVVLAVRWEERHPYFWPQWGYRIGIWNEGPATADDVEVMLNTITPQPTMDLNVLPSLLGHKDGYCAGTHCSINKHREHLYDLVHRRGSGVWTLLTVAQTRIVLLEKITYIFDVVISAHNQKNGAVHAFIEISPRLDGWLDVRVLESAPSSAAVELTPAPSAALGMTPGAGGGGSRTALPHLRECARLPLDPRSP